MKGVGEKLGKCLPALISTRTSSQRSIVTPIIDGTRYYSPQMRQDSETEFYNFFFHSR
jgi:hypothetical protein